MDPHRWLEIQSTFDAIVEMDHDERVSQLTALSTSDPELRAAVELLLAADSDADARLASLDKVFFPDSAPSVDPLGLAEQTVSHFEVHESIGAGGMGVVYRALDTRLGRDVALKFLLPSHSMDAGAKARFVREARLVATLDHPNLCTIHEVGTSDNGRFFLAMALYPGETLKTRMTRDGSMQVIDALDIAKQILEGLKCAHDAGIVHRDLKPGNVMLLPDGTVKILDFGLAKARDQSLSEPGARFGTVSYMSPEQIRGETADARADLWAVGVVLYEMLTARKPFGGDQDIAVAHAILHDDPVPISMHRRDMQPTLEDLALRLLEKDPGKRYSTASDVLTDLARVDTKSKPSMRSLHARWRRGWRAVSPARKRYMTAFGAVGVGGFFVWSAVHRDPFFVGTRALERFDLERAEVEFARAAKQKPDDPVARLWLGQTMMLNGKATSEWQSSVTFASSHRDQLKPVDQKRVDALTAFALEQFPNACDRFAEVSSAERRANPDLYISTVALADCLAADQAVVPSGESPSGYRFRNSYHRIETLYRSTLQQVSTPDTYAKVLPRLRRVLLVDKNKSRLGFGVNRERSRFLSQPVLAGDTVGYVPYLFSTADAWRPGDDNAHDAALARNRARLRELSIAWTKEDPRSPDAHAFLGRILETTGELTGGQHAAMDEVRAARSLARAPPGSSASTFLDDLRLGTSEVRLWLRLGHYDKAAMLADSLLTFRIPAELDESGQEEAAETLSAFAALRGRFRMLLDLEKRFSAQYQVRLSTGEPVTLPPALGSDAIALVAYAAVGVEPDSVRAIAERISENIKSLIAPAKAAGVRDAILMRSFALAAPMIGPAPLASLGPSRDLNVEAIRFLAKRDRVSARKLADSLTALRSAFAPGQITMDAVYQDAWLRAAVGDTAGAAALLDNALRGLSVAFPSIVANPVEAACFVRATILRAELAAAMQRPAIAKARAAQAYQLWGQGDPVITASLHRISQLR